MPVAIRFDGTLLAQGVQGRLGGSGLVGQWQCSQDVLARSSAWQARALLWYHFQIALSIQFFD